MEEKTKLKITTITPVTIGSGAELSSDADYVIDNNQVCFIDKKKMVEKIMQKGEHLLDHYVQGVAMGNNSNFDLKLFLTNNRIINDIDEVVFSRCAFTTKTPGSKLPIKGLLKTPLQEPYIAGSSIKGALKTALMYNWLKTNGNAGRKIEKVINGDDFTFLKKEFEYNVETDFGTNTIKQITDSRPFSIDCKVVVDCFRKMPIRFECIDKNNTTDFELTLNNYKWRDLSGQVNQYVLDVIEREFDLIENDDETINRYHNHLATIEEMVMEADENTAFLRIGFGKGYYLNSLGIAIYNYASQNGKEELFDKFELFLKEKFAKKEKTGDFSLEHFPKTRLFVTKTQEPLGWIKIEKMV